MNKFIQEELSKTRNVSFTDERGNEIENLDDVQEIYIRPKNGSYNEEYIFTFADYLIQPFSGFDFNVKFNKGKNIPLKVMKGKIIRTVGKMYYIKVSGYYQKTNKCNHCLKEQVCDSICKECYEKLHICEIENVTWEGFVPIKSIISTERI